MFGASPTPLQFSCSFNSQGYVGLSVAGAALLGNQPRGMLLNGSLYRSCLFQRGDIYVGAQCNINAGFSCQRGVTFRRAGAVSYIHRATMAPLTNIVAAVK